LFLFNTKWDSDGSCESCLNSDQDLDDLFLFNILPLDGLLHMSHED
jgi:hypothetical protein